MAHEAPPHEAADVPKFRDRIVELRRVPASDLTANPANWREHDDKQRSALAGVLDELGFAGALIARTDEDGALVLIDGHLRRELADDADTLPVLVTDLTQAEADLMLATYDPIGAMATSDADALQALLMSVVASTPSAAATLERVEFNAKVKKRGLSRVDPSIADPTDELRTKWGTDRGQLWTAGPHRLACGDSFEEADMARLIGDEGAVDAILTDPPYAIYGSATGISSTIADDKMVRPFFASIFRLARERVKVFGHVYVHCDWRSWAAVWEGARAAGIVPKNCIVWDKGSFGLGANYQNTHEFVGFFAHLPPERAMTVNNASGQRQVLSSPNVVHFPRPRGDDRKHNAAKPVELLELLIGNSTEPDESVLDPFLGSASTIVACHRSGRRGLGMEMEPNWLAVSLERLASFGLEPERVE